MTRETAVGVAEGSKVRITRYMWLVLFICVAGYSFDAYEVMLYSNALPDIAKEMNFNLGAAGGVMTFSLLGFAFGGMFWGPMADRIGRKKVLMYTIAGYAIFTGLTALCWNPASLIAFRFIMGLFAGGVWSAAAALLAETWPAEIRGFPIGIMQTGWPIGSIIASLCYMWIGTHYGWRWVFVTGAIPAVFVVWIARSLKESEYFVSKAKGPAESRVAWYGIFGRKYVVRTIMFIVISFVGLFGVWGVITWLPTLLRQSFGMSPVQAYWWVTLYWVMAAFGYVAFGIVSDRIGRRPSFTIYWLVFAGCIPLFTLVGVGSKALLATIVCLLGVFTGYFTGYPTYGSEIYPTALRASGMGIGYTGIARVGSTFSPMFVGYLAQSIGLAKSMAYLLPAGFILAIICIWSMGFETRGKTLDEIEAM